MLQSKVRLNNGIMMPSFFCGTNFSNEDILENVVDCALSVGCLAFDTSPNYASGAWLGKTLRKLLPKYGLKREDVFVQSKLDWNWMISDQVEEALSRLLKVMEMDYLDAWIMHWPQPDTFVKCYHDMERIYQSGRIKSIGVSNFLLRHWSILCSSNITVIPQINQIELHPLRTCQELVEFCNSMEIVTQSYSPLCKMIPEIRENRELGRIAEKYKCTIAQLIIAWHHARGLVPINKSSKPNRFRENMGGMNIHLDDVDVKKISMLNRNYKLIVESIACPGF